VTPCATTRHFGRHFATLAQEPLLSRSCMSRVDWALEGSWRQNFKSQPSSSARRVLAAPSRDSELDDDDRPRIRSHDFPPGWPWSPSHVRHIDVHGDDIGAWKRFRQRNGLAGRLWRCHTNLELFVQRLKIPFEGPSAYNMESFPRPARESFLLVVAIVCLRHRRDGDAAPPFPMSWFETRCDQLILLDRLGSGMPRRLPSSPDRDLLCAPRADPDT